MKQLHEEKVLEKGKRARKQKKRGRGRLKWRPRGKGEKKWEGRGGEGRGKNGREKRTEQREENTIGKKDCGYNITLLEQQSVYQGLGNYFTEALK